MKFKVEELEQYAEKLVNWYAEGAFISNESDEEQDYFEIIIIDTDGVRSYQEFNYYLGNKLWDIYSNKLGEYHNEKFPIDN